MAMLGDTPTDITITDILAVWGAAVATLVLIWDIYKWAKSGPRIVLHACPDMKVIGVNEVSEDKTWVSVDAANIGDRPTTITTLGTRYYPSWFEKLRNKPKYSTVVPSPLSGRLPYKLGPGERWSGCFEQDRFEEEVYQGGILVVELYTSHAKSPNKVRVKLQSPEKSETS